MLSINNLLKSPLRAVVAVLLAALLTACAGGPDVAPVQDRTARTGSTDAGPSRHRVRAGETLSSIAAKYGLDYRYIARLNNIEPPYVILRDQQLLLGSPRQARADRSARRTTSDLLAGKRSAPVLGVPLPGAPATASSTSAARNSGSKLTWGWPAQGELLRGSASGEKGISIAGRDSQPIQAASAGRVAYSGSGLVGLGNLVIIKHDKSFLSAYAHNKRILVKEGDKVALGQTIAEMGSTGTERTMLYFEIRKDGKTVDPLLYLPKTGR